MKLKNVLMPFLFLAFGAIYLSSCGEDEVAVDFDESKDVSADYNTSQSEIDQLMSYTDQAIRTAGGGRIKANDIYCAAFSHDSTSRTVTLDFGTTGCTGADGRIRKGKIVMTYVGRTDAAGLNARNVTFVNYSVNGNAISGTLLGTRWTVVQGSSALTSILTATDLRMTFAEDNSVFVINGTWTRKITIDAQNFSNSSYAITGSSNGTTREGKAFASNIVTPITFKLSCVQSKIPYAVSGTQDISVNTAVPFVARIDYGSGACDKIITITVNGKSTEYTLP